MLRKLLKMLESGDERKCVRFYSEEKEIRNIMTVCGKGRQVCLLCEKGKVRMSKNDRCPMDIGVRTTCVRCMAGAPYHQCCRLECHQHEFCRGCQWNPDLEGGDKGMKLIGEEK